MTKTRTDAEKPDGPAPATKPAAAKEPATAPRTPPPKKFRPKGRSLVKSAREVVGARQILANLVRRDFSAQHRNSFLGLAWSLINPLLLVGVYTLFFKIIRMSPQGEKLPFALYFFSGLIIWNLFSTGFHSGTRSIVQGTSLIKKVYFPREILPMSSVLSAGITFIFELIVALVAATALGHLPDWHIVFTLIPIAITIMIGYGMALIFSAINVYFRDVEHFIGIFTQVWFFLSPVIYNVKLVADHGDKYLRIFELNPFVAILVSFRDALLGHAMPDWGGLAYSAVFAVVLVVGGQIFFNRHEFRFAELV